MPKLGGIHDREGRVVAPADSWVLDTIAISENILGTKYGEQVAWIGRLNWGYGSAGTLPPKAQYGEFAQRVATYVEAATGCSVWVIGNEPNLSREWPNGEAILPDDYAEAYRLCRNAIHAIPGHEQDQVLVAGPGPWNDQLRYEGNANGDWVAYFEDVIDAIGSACDGFALHAYTHGFDPALVSSEARMDAPFAHRRYHFRVYRDFAQAIPTKLRHLPIYITEANGNGPWQARGLMPAMLEEIAQWNAAGGQTVRAVIFYRYPKYDDGIQFNMDDKPDVLAEFRAAVERYLGPQGVPTAPTSQPAKQFIPSLSKAEDKSAPTVPPREVDPRAERRGTKIITPTVAPGTEFWHVKRLYTPNEEESDRLGPDHHILANVLQDGERQVGVPLLVTWGGGGSNERTTVYTKKNDAFAFSADQPLSPGDYTLEVADGRLSEKVVGLKMGAFDAEGRWNPGAHESALIDFELVTMPAIEAPQPPPIAQPQPQQPAQVPALAHPIQVPAKRVISQRFGENPQDYVRFGLAGHNGLDFAVPVGTPVVAVDDGQAIELGNDEDGYGVYVKMRHAWGESLYAHLDVDFLDQGNWVSKGLVIGLSGNTGNSTGPHLHFALRVNPYTRGAPFDGFSDPAPYLINVATPVQPQPTTQREIVKAIASAALEFDVDSDLLLSQALAESSFDSRAVSNKGAKGLLQIMPNTWAEQSALIGAGNDPFDPQQNARVGARYMKYLLGALGNKPFDALVAYGWGIGNVLGDAPYPDEWVAYANKIIHGRDLLKAVG